MGGALAIQTQTGSLTSLAAHWIGLAAPWAELATHLAILADGRAGQTAARAVGKTAQRGGNGVEL